MRVCGSTVLAVFASMLKPGLAAPLVVRPDSSADVMVTALDTLNSTTTSVSPANGTTDTDAAGQGTLSVDIVNNLRNDNATAYITGLDTNGQLMILDQSGSYYYPKASSATPEPLGSNIAISLGTVNATTTLTLPGFIQSARIWIAEGSLSFFVVETAQGPGLVEPSVRNSADPNAETNYAFMEFDWSAASGLYADITYVDFVGLPLGISVLDGTGNTQSAPGIPPNAVDALCSNLKAQAQQDGHPWDQLCMYNANKDLIRVISAGNYISMNSSAFEGYFTQYGTSAWQRFMHASLTIDTQSAAGNVNCSVKDQNSMLMTCDGDNRGYAIPSSSDIFGCNSGPFAIEATDNAVHRAVVPRLCAALNRVTLSLLAGNVQPSVPPSDYYTVHPANWYSSFVHRLAANGRGYAFPYDDVTPTNGEDVSALIHLENATKLTVTAGGA